MTDTTLYALLVVLAILIVGAMFFVAERPRREGYLIYPYLDLDEPGERGSYYGMTDHGLPSRLGDGC